jgi:hypothetical protein
MKHFIYLFPLLFAIGNAHAQTNAHGWDVEFIMTIPWNDQTGIPYVKVPGANLGAVAFAKVGNDKIALLCNSTNEIRVFSTSNGQLTKKFAVGFAPRDFVFDGSSYYVLFDRHVALYSLDGTEMKNVSFPDEAYGVSRFTVVDGAIHLWLPAGNSLTIYKNGKMFREEHVGWICPDGSSVYTEIVAGQAKATWYRDGAKTQRIFVMDRKVAGVFPVGVLQDKVILDVQTFISEGPVEVERHFVSMVIDDDNALRMVKAPDTYYVYADRDIFQDSDGSLLNMVTAPDGVHLYRLALCSDNTCADFPEDLDTIKYHFNFNLIKVD